MSLAQVTIVFFGAIFLFFLFGIGLPWAISAPNTESVIGGLLIIVGVTYSMIGVVYSIIKKLNKGNK